MRTRLALVLPVVVVLWVAPGHAQQATERYIPIGRSPGASEGSTLRATVAAIDVEGGGLVLESEAGAREVVIDDATRIWLDRTALGRSNLTASLSDCRVGLDVEVKFAAGGRTAEWIKIRAPGDP